MFAKIKEKIKGMFKSKKSLGIAVGVIIILIVASYIFKSYIYPRLNPTYVSNKEFTQQENESVTKNTSDPPEIANINYLKVSLEILKKDEFLQIINKVYV